MIGKQIISADFGSVLNYNEKKIKSGKGEMLSTNMLGDNAKILTKEFSLIMALKPNVTKAVYHTSLSISPEEKLTNKQFQEVGEKYLDQMGFGNSQYVIYRHTDQEHPHIHIVANRIDMDGKVVSDKWNYKKSEKIIRKLEKEYGLKEVISSEKVEEKAMSKGQIENLRRTGSIPIKTQLQVLVKESLLNSRSIKDFENEMYKAGANVKLHRNGKGNVFGISFELEGIKFKASQLGKGYSWNKIKTQFKDEQNQGTGENQSRGENSDTRTTGQTNTASKYSGYTGVEDGANTNTKEFGRFSDGDPEGRGQLESNSNSTQGCFGIGAEAIAPDELHSDENGGEIASNEDEDLSSSHTSGFTNGFNLLFGSSNRLAGESIDDAPKKKKKKRRRKI